MTLITTSKPYRDEEYCGCEDKCPKCCKKKRLRILPNPATPTVWTHSSCCKTKVTK